ncbi:MAG: NADH-quinone oxidoreductase subunit NuoG [Actinomycetota bacterium]
MTATEPTEAVTGVPFTLNGREVEAKQGELLIDACDRNGVHIPRFCYHPRMEPVGMCRMCLVEVDTGRGLGLQPSCMVPVSPDMKVETESQVTKDAQDGVLELLLINHPLDCPVCDKGGECPLQDNAYAFGPGESRFVEEKRHYEKPIPISDLVHLDRERCILCDRCTRFASDVAGDPLIHFIDRGSQTQVNTFPDHPFSSYFSGNTVQICPVGALTASPYRFKARPWDLDAVESTVTVDPGGSRVVLQSSQNEVIRILGVDSDAVNWGWLSDKERFSYEVAASPNRLVQPEVRNDDGEREPARWNDAIRAAVTALRRDASRVGLIGGARLPIEDQYAWAKLMKGVVGTDHVDSQLGDGLPGPMALGLPRATIDEACQPGGVVVLIGPDPKEDLPTLYLRMRHAVTQDNVDLIEVTPRATSLTPFARHSLRALPGTAGQLMTAVGDNAGGFDDIDRETIEQVNELLTSGRPVTVVLGRPNLAESPRYIADAAGALLKMLPEVRFLPLLRRGNVMGALEMGLTPGFLPGGLRRAGTELADWRFLPEFDGRDTEGMLRAALAGEIDTIVLLGADPIADFPQPDLARAALERTTVISLDAFDTDSTAMADIVFPVALFGERDGTFCNVEGRLSPIRAKVTPPGQVRSDWMVAVELATALGAELPSSLEDIRAEITTNAASLGSIDWNTVDRGEDGPLIDRNRHWVLEFGDAAAPPAAGDYGLRLVVDHKLWDEGTMVQQSGSLQGLVQPAVLRVAPSDLADIGVNDGDVVIVESPNQQVDLPVHADGAVAPGTAWLPVRLPGVDARELLSPGQAISNVAVRAAGAQ